MITTGNLDSARSTGRNLELPQGDPKLNKSAPRSTGYDPSRPFKPGSNEAAESRKRQAPPFAPLPKQSPFASDRPYSPRSSWATPGQPPDWQHRYFTPGRDTTSQVAGQPSISHVNSTPGPAPYNPRRSPFASDSRYGQFKPEAVRRSSEPLVLPTPTPPIRSQSSASAKEKSNNSPFASDHPYGKYETENQRKARKWGEELDRYHTTNPRGVKAREDAAKDPPRR